MTNVGSRARRHLRSPLPGSIPPVSPSRPAAAPERAGTGRRLSVVLGGVGLVALVVGIIMLSHGSTSVRDSGLGSLTAILTVISLVATLAYLAVFVGLHVLPTGYSPVRHAVSDYAVGRYAPLFRAGLYASSVAVLLLAFGLIRGVGSPPLSARDVLYLLLIPIIRVGMTIFPTNLEGQRLTRSGALHYVFAIAAFTLTYLAISEMTSTLRTINATAWLDSPLRWTAWAVAPELALVVLTMLRPLRRVFGLFERLFLVTTNLWFLLVALLVIDVVR